MSNSKILNLFF